MTHPHLPTAYHEAGHATVAYYFGRQILGVKINGDSGIVRYNAHGPALEECCICLAGPISERRLTGVVDRAASRSDRLQAWDWLDRLSVDKRVLFGQAARATEGLIDQNWSAISKVAGLLIRRGCVRGREVHALCDSLQVRRF